MMNRIELVALFTALKVLYDEKNIEGMGKIIEAVLREAEAERKSDKVSYTTE